MVSQIAKIDHIKTDGEADALILEAVLVRKHLPKYNIDLRDDKNFPLVKITNEKLPRILIVRKEINDGAKYFGPFTEAIAIKNALRFLRKAFPYATEKHSKICFRNYLNLCPCALTPEYRKNLRILSKILNGQKEIEIKKLKTSMEKYSKRLEFEKAKVIKDQLDALNHVFNPKYKPWQYEENPNLYSDLRKQELDELATIIGSKVNRIECIDISHIGGKNVTSSLVVFVGAVPSKNDYRHFKIKLEKNDDVAAITETVQRRLKHKEWPNPDLMIIDGGLPQLNAIKDLLTWPVAAIAKRDEELYFQNQKVKLPEDSHALNLIKRLRDEAHRFSRRYHFHLRSKKVLE